MDDLECFVHPYDRAVAGPAQLTRVGGLVALVALSQSQPNSDMETIVAVSLVPWLPSHCPSQT